MKILFLIAAIGLAAIGCSQDQTSVQPPTAQPLNMQLSVYKTPNCGCCQLWIDHLDNTGFVTETTNQPDLTALKNSFGIDQPLRSCHTAVHEQGYVFEGHVPAKFIKQFLAAPQAGASGLSVPNMPIGSPGMEVGERFDPYDIVLLMKQGEHRVYAHVSRYEEQF